MDNKEAVVCIRNNWPDERYSMLREALEKAIAALEAAELAPTPNTGSPKLLMPSVGVFIQTGCELGMKGSTVSRLYHAVVAQLRASA